MIRSGLFFWIILILTIGCGSNPSDGPNRRVVKGIVTYEGTPITEGVIRFVPIGKTAGPVSSAYIRNGSFNINHKGGVPLGQQRVEIEAYRPVTKLIESSPMDDGPSQEQFLPRKWNAESTLELIVKAGRTPLQHEFSLSN